MPALKFSFFFEQNGRILLMLTTIFLLLSSFYSEKFILQIPFYEYQKFDFTGIYFLHFGYV